MMKFIFFVYWYWYSTWIYRYYYADFSVKGYAIKYVTEGIYQLGFIFLLPLFLMIYSSNTINTDKWAKLCLITGIGRLFCLIAGYNGFQNYGYLYVFSLFGMLAYFGITSAFDKNSKSLNYWW